MTTPPSLADNPVDPGFSDEKRKSRYGVAYVRSICAHAGVSFSETEIDEDVQAIDAEIRFPILSSRIQIKCTSKFSIGGHSATMELDPKWVKKWSSSIAPIYFIVVIVPKRIPNWVEHLDESTSHKTAAFWARFDAAVHIDRIQIPKSQRLTVETIHEWNAQISRQFGLETS